MFINDDIINEAVKALAYFKIRVAKNSLSTMNSFSNFVWKVRGVEDDFILRRYSRLKLDDVITLNNNLRYIRNLGFHIPSTIPSIDGKDALSYNGHVYELSEYIEHIPLTYKDMNISPDQLRIAGSALSKIHRLDIQFFPFPLRNKSNEELNPEYVLTLVKRFRSSFALITKQVDFGAREKLYVLAELINRTSERREKAADSIREVVEHLPKSLTHGDFSLSNLLPETDKAITIIDWENMGIRPRIWELHRSLLLICGKGKCNANFDELNFDRATVFIRSYKELISVTDLEWSCLPDIVEYVAFVHWLRFTLESVLHGDLRILDKIPDRVDEGLWWLINLDRYVSWIRKISS